MYWEAISAISTLVGAVVVVITAIFAVMQLTEAHKARKLALIVKLFEELSSEKSRNLRRFIYTEVPNNVEELTSDHFLLIDQVLSSMDLIWLLIEHGQLERTFIFEAYGQVFLKLWAKLEQIVNFERSRRGSYYRVRSETLIQQIRVYFRKKGKPTNYKVYKENPTDQNGLSIDSISSETLLADSGITNKTP